MYFSSGTVQERRLPRSSRSGDLSRCADNHQHDFTYFSLPSLGANHHICWGLFCETVCVFFSSSWRKTPERAASGGCYLPAAKKAALWIKSLKARWWRLVNTLCLFIYLFILPPAGREPCSDPPMVPPCCCCFHLHIKRESTLSGSWGPNLFALSWIQLAQNFNFPKRLKHHISFN